MISRQVVCSDPRVRRLLERMIPTADYPNRYRLGKEAGRDHTLEYRLLYGALRESSFRNSVDRWFVQGMYVITPSGKLIAGGNRPADVESTLADIRRGLEAYERMPRAQRLLPRPPHPVNDRMQPPPRPPAPPAGGLVLRAVGRGLDGVVGDFCPMKPPYYSLDRVWLTREEAEQFLPRRLQPGAETQVSGPVLTGLAQLHLKGSGPRWHRHEVKEGELTARVTAVSGTTVQLRLTGRAALAANSDYNRQTYRPDLAGSLAYDTARRRFTRFELLAYGPHSVPEQFRVRGGSTTVPYALLFTLNGSGPFEDRPPTRLRSYAEVGLKAGS